MNRLAAGCVLALILILAAVLRCDHLTDRTLWFDEAFSYTLVSRFAPWEIIARTAQDVHPPLYYLLLWCWTSCLGTSLISLRALSVLLGVATVGVSYAVGRDAVARQTSDETLLCRGRAAGIIAAALVATSAVQVRWSWEARMYSLATFLLVSGTWCLLRALDAPRPRAWWWGGFAAFSTATLYTHNYAMFSFLGLCLFTLVEISRREGRWSIPWASAQFWPAALSIAVAVWLYLPWVPTLLAQKARVQDDYWIASANLLSIPRAWFCLFVPINSAGSLSDQWAGVFGVVLLLFVAALAFCGHRLHRLSLSVMLTPVVVAYFISVTSVSIIVDRHFLLAHVFALIGIAGLIAELTPFSVYALASCLLIFDSLYALQNYRTELNVAAKPGVHGAVEYVLKSRVADEPVLVLHPCIYFSVRYYAAGRAESKLYTLPENVSHYTGGPILVSDDLLPLESLEQIRAKRIWVLDTNGFISGYYGMMLPAGWEARDSQRFPDVYFFQGDVRVTLYERIPSAQAGDRTATDDDLSN